MSNIFKKLSFSINRPCVIVVTGQGRACASEAVFQALKPYFKVRKCSKIPLVKNKKEVLIIESKLDNSDIHNFQHILKNSSLPILIGTNVGRIPFDRNFFAGEKKDTLPIRRLSSVMPSNGYLVLNFDDETVREIKDKASCHCLTFGFQKGSDIQATDINTDKDGNNFKINYSGKMIPFWLKNVFGKEQIYSVLAGVGVGIIKEINLVGISQALKTYQSLDGKMKLVEGVKNTLILDDSQNADINSMIEALKTLKRISDSRKVVVLGDILGIGKYSIEAHESLGSHVAKNSDLFFAIGPRSKFIAKGAIAKGMKQENVFQFETSDQAKLSVQKLIRKNDLILVDGSKEMKMGGIVQEIRKA